MHRVVARRPLDHLVRRLCSCGATKSILPRPATTLSTRKTVGTRIAQLRRLSTTTAVMKRKEAPTKAEAATKKKRPDVPEYVDTPTVKDEDGRDIWPAPEDQIQKAREIILECAKAGKKTLIVPDKDADGLSSGVILHRSLEILGLSPDLILVHLVDKGNAVHNDIERERMAIHAPSYIFVLDQGSRSGPPLLSYPHTCLVIDHHHATPSDFPTGASYVTACNSPPVATSALLTYTICTALSPKIAPATDWLAIIGTHGDLGTTLKWTSPFPDMTGPLKTYTKKLLNEAVSAINAPRRTAERDVSFAWSALLSATHPRDIMRHPRLAAARAEVAAEVERCTHTAPKFSPDGRIAVFRIRSQAQVHPIIATRWAGHLNSKALEVVMVANEGYLEGKVNFSCRVARCAKARGQEVDIIRSLKEWGSLEAEEVDDGDGDEGSSNGIKEEDVEAGGGSQPDTRPLLERLGEDFARGHVQASGGIVDPEAFEELMQRMRIGEKSEAQKKREEEKARNGGGGMAGDSKKKKAIDPGQKNTLAGYFGAGKKGAGVKKEGESVFA